MEDNFIVDYEVIFTNGKDKEIHLISHNDTDNYNEIKNEAELYANDEASGFLASRDYKVKSITKLI